MASDSGRLAVYVAIIFAALVGGVSGLVDAKLSDIFYPFGTDVGDRQLPISDDGFSPAVNINVTLPFFNKTRSKIYVNTNGALSFDAGLMTYDTGSFPINGSTIVAPYLTDIDTTANKGRVYYRQTTDGAMLDRASLDVQAAFSSQGFSSFRASWIFVATWHNVTYFGGNASSPVLSFQAVLVTDGLHSFALFNYGNLTWSSGLGSNLPAQVGFNAGDMVNYYVIPSSRTPDVVTAGASSNVGVRGRWAFRIDSARITLPECATTLGSGDNHGTAGECGSVETATTPGQLGERSSLTAAATTSSSAARVETIAAAMVTVLSRAALTFSSTASSLTTRFPIDESVSSHDAYLPSTIALAVIAAIFLIVIIALVVIILCLRRRPPSQSSTDMVSAGDMDTNLSISNCASGNAYEQLSAKGNHHQAADYEQLEDQKKVAK